MAYALTINSHLIILDIRLNYIGDPGGKDFAHALVKNETLLSLNLAANRLTENSAYVFGKMLQHNTTLKELDVSSNSIGKKGKIIALMTPQTLPHLNVSRLLQVASTSQWVSAKIKVSSKWIFVWLMQRLSSSTMWMFI